MQEVWIYSHDGPIGCRIRERRPPHTIDYSTTLPKLQRRDSLLGGVFFGDIEFGSQRVVINVSKSVHKFADARILAVAGR
eukprot:4268725-Pyramimonas_sp.AAC.1